MELTAENVNEVFHGCLYNEGEDSSDKVVGEAVRMIVGFHPERLKANKLKIEAFINQLPDKFRIDGGGGASFLEACFTKNRIHWGEHQNIDQLLALGNAIGKIVILLPRHLWSTLPGGMPYFVIN